MKTTTIAVLVIALCGCGAPKPHPSFEPPPEAPRGDLYGWWVSRSHSGPNSEGVRRVEMIFNRDGSYEAVGIVEEGRRLRVHTTVGKFAVGDGSVTVDYSDGRSKTYGFRLEEGELILKDGDAEIRLGPAP